MKRRDDWFRRVLPPGEDFPSSHARSDPAQQNAPEQLIMDLLRRLNRGDEIPLPVVSIQRTCDLSK